VKSVSEPAPPARLLPLNLEVLVFGQTSATHLASEVEHFGGRTGIGPHFSLCVAVMIRDRLRLIRRHEPSIPAGSKVIKAAESVTDGQVRT
jgi:hypothetical protein